MLLKCCMLLKCLENVAVSPTLSADRVLNVDLKNRKVFVKHCLRSESNMTDMFNQTVCKFLLIINSQKL